MFSDGDSDELDVGFPSRRTSSAMQHNAPTSGVAVRGGNTAQHISLDSVGENDHHDGAAYRGRRPSLEGVDQMQRRGSRKGLGMQRRPSLSTLATGERRAERMQRRPSSGALGTGERMQRRPSLGSLATGERTAQQVSSRDMRDDGKRSRLRSRSRDAIGRSGMQRRPSMGNLVDEDTTERRRSRSRDRIGRSEPQRRSSLGRMDIGRDTDDHSDQGAAAVSTEFEDADRFEVDRKDGLQRQSSLSEMQQTAKDLLPLVGWDASDAASSIAERDHNLHQPQGHKSIKSRSRDVFDQKVCTSLTDGENRSNVEDRENRINVDGQDQAGGSRIQESTAVGARPVNESPPLMGWGASDAASSSSENDQAKDDESFGSDDGTEIYEDFRPRGEFRESTSKPISERKVEEEFDSRRPWRKAPVDQRPHLKKGTSESGSVMSFSMDANAAIPKDRRSSRFDPGTIDEGLGVNQPVARKADATNLVRKGSAKTAGKEGSELGELEMARTALGRTEFAFSDRGALRSTLIRAGDTHHTDPYGNTNPYGSYANANYDDLEDARIHDHPGTYTGPLDREHGIQARADDVKRSSFTSSSEGDEEEGVAGTFTDLKNDDNDNSKVEVDTSLLRETAARPKKESVDSQTTTTAQVYSESAESEQQQLFGAGDSSKDSIQYLEEGADTSRFGQHQPDGPSAHGDAINPVTQHHQKEAVLPTSVTNETNSKQVSFEAMGIEPSSNQGQDVGDAGSSEYDEEEARDIKGHLSANRPDSSQPDERRKLMETAQSGASGESLGYNESSPDMVTSNADQGRSDRDWPSYADQEASEPALEEKKQRLGSRGSRRFSAMFISSNLLSFKPSGGKIQRCVGPYVYERRKLFLAGGLLLLALIACLSASFAVVKNDKTPDSGTEVRSANTSPTSSPTISLTGTNGTTEANSSAPTADIISSPIASPVSEWDDVFPGLDNATFEDVKDDWLPPTDAPAPSLPPDDFDITLGDDDWFGSTEGERNFAGENQTDMGNSSGGGSDIIEANTTVTESPTLTSTSLSSTLSAAPSVSPQPSAVPSVSRTPTISNQPSLWLSSSGPPSSSVPPTLMATTSSSPPVYGDGGSNRGEANATETDSPTLTISPTLSPTVSAAPSISPEPSAVPSASHTPTLSAKPSLRLSSSGPSSSSASPTSMTMALLSPSVNGDDGSNGGETELPLFEMEGDEERERKRRHKANPLEFE